MQQIARPGVLSARTFTPGRAAAPPAGGSVSPPEPDRADPAEAVTALYRDHAVGMTRMAHIMLGSRAAAEDVVQDAFCGLYRHWP